ncbi:MAG TPA: hypothetical protein VLJ59_01865 [Mycobacteriales bacterium]|nr:hypothetical protein [Mycobacteriales bacterium]
MGSSQHRPGLLPNGDLDPAVFPHLATAEALATGHAAGRADQDTDDTAAWAHLAARVRALAAQPTYAELRHRRGEPPQPTTTTTSEGTGQP